MKIIQSFADARCNKNGLVYMACNFIYYGYHEGDFYKYKDEFVHPVSLDKKKGDRRFFDVKKEELVKVYYRQYRFIYYIDQKLRDKCLLKEKDYKKEI